MRSKHISSAAQRGAAAGWSGPARPGPAGCHAKENSERRKRAGSSSTAGGGGGSAERVVGEPLATPFLEAFLQEGQVARCHWATGPGGRPIASRRRVSTSP